MRRIVDDVASWPVHANLTVAVDVEDTALEMHYAASNHRYCEAEAAVVECTFLALWLLDVPERCVASFTDLASSTSFSTGTLGLGIVGK